MAALCQLVPTAAKYRGKFMLNSVLAFVFAFFATSFIPYGVASSVYEADGFSGCTPDQDRNRMIAIGVILPLLLVALSFYLLAVPGLSGALVAVAVIWWRIFL